MLAIALAIAKANGAKADAMEEGWMILRDAMLTGKIRARGIPYQFRTHGSATKETSGLRRDLLKVEIEETTCRITDDIETASSPRTGLFRTCRSFATSMSSAATFWKCSDL
jgi:hypothetical protein